MKNKDRHFVLFANCIPVKGFNRSVVCDIQRGKYVFIPNGLYELTKYFCSDRVADLLVRFPELSEETLTEYLDFLLDYGLGFYTDNPSEFPGLHESFRTPYLLNDCIIELSDSNMRFAGKIINELWLTGCQNLELRSYEYFDMEILFDFIKKLDQTKVRNVEVYNSFGEFADQDCLSQYMIESQIVSRYYIHSAPANSISEYDERIISFSNKIDADSCCGNISPYYFSINLPFFLEARKYNSCLYRKIAIDREGNIKNCPSLPMTFGHIKTTGFLEVIDHLAFRDLWHINKDQIDTCKDCEFRYICSDCRAFLSNAKDKPAKCNYNPYTNVYEK